MKSKKNWETEEWTKENARAFDAMILDEVEHDALGELTRRFRRCWKW